MERTTKAAKSRIPCARHAHGDRMRPPASGGTAPGMVTVRKPGSNGQRHNPGRRPGTLGEAGHLLWGSTGLWSRVIVSVRAVTAERRVISVRESPQRRE